MKRRQFLYQALSVSAVAVGTGYATMDMLRRSSDKWTVTEAAQAQKAAARALRNAPQTDEALASAPARQTVASAPGTDAGKRFSMPAEAVNPRGPAYETPGRPDAARTSASTETQPSKSVAPTPSSRQPKTSQRAVEAAPGKSGADDAPTATVNRSAEAVVEPEVPAIDESEATVPAPDFVAEAEDQSEKFRQKVQHFEYDFSDDVFIAEADYRLLVSALERLNRVEAYVGHGNFNILSFDEMLQYGRYQPRIGQFPKAELDYLEQLFYDDVSQLGFFGERIIANLTHRINSNDIQKIPKSGHYLFKGHSEQFYEKVRSQVGEGLILTSGIRGIVKQYHLFMAKVVQAEGNLSRASRSLAPPGHSYHAIGDFDVGRVGGGLSNFTADFAKTDEFKRLQDLGFVQIRYTSDNNYGVRYEPWHIRVV